MQRGDFEEILQNALTSADVALTALASYAMLRTIPAPMNSHDSPQTAVRPGFRRVKHCVSAPCEKEDLP